MENRHADEFDLVLKDYRAIKLKIIQKSAGMALAFFKQSFTNQGFTDQNLVKWNHRKGGYKNNGRAILIDRGTLKRGLRIKSATNDGAIVGEDEGIKYADIQNFGGQIPLTPKMRRFFWAMYYKFGGGIKGKQPSDVALFYRNLALSKQSHITIPARKFIGDSATLERQLIEYITKELDKFFRVE